MTIDEIKEIIQLLTDSGVAEIEVQHQGLASRGGEFKARCVEIDDGRPCGSQRLHRFLERIEYIWWRRNQRVEPA